MIDHIRHTYRRLFGPLDELLARYFSAFPTAHMHQTSVQALWSWAHVNLEEQLRATPDLVFLTLTASQFMALTSLLGETIRCRAGHPPPAHSEAFVDVTRDITTTDEDLLELLLNATPPSRKAPP